MSKFFCSGFLLTMVLAVGCQRVPHTAEISIEDIWSRPVLVAHEGHAGMMTDSSMANMPHMGSNGVVYLVMQNRGGVADRLLRVQSNVCATTEFHETIMDGDRMMMRPVEGGIEIPTQGSAKLAPGGRHLMLLGLNHSLTVGDSVELHLEFEQSGTKTVFSVVRQP